MMDRVGHDQMSIRFCQKCNITDPKLFVGAYFPYASASFCVEELKTQFIQTRNIIFRYKNRPGQKYQQIQKKLILGGLFACFNYQPNHGDLHGFISTIINTWLPNSGYSYRQQPIHYKLENITAMASDFSNNPEVEIFVPISPSSNSG